MHIYIYIVYIHKYLYILLECIYNSIYLPICLSTYLSIYLCVCVSVCLCVCVYMYVYTYMCVRYSYEFYATDRSDGASITWPALHFVEEAPRLCPSPSRHVDAWKVEA